MLPASAARTGRRRRTRPERDLGRAGIPGVAGPQTAAESARTAGQDQIPADVLAAGDASFRHVALVGVKDHAGQRFAHDLRCPFDNNAAEREVGMVKVRQKIFGAMRTLTGAQHFCHLRSYLATASKHGINLFDALVQLTSGRPWILAIN